MSRFLDALFPFRKAPNATSTTGMGIWKSNENRSRVRRGTQQLLEAYSNSPRLRAVVDRIAKSVAAQPWSAYRVPNGISVDTILKDIRASSEIPGGRRGFVKVLEDEGSLDRVENSRTLNILNQPNPMISARNLKQLSQVHLDLVGESFWILERNGSGVPTEIWPVPPSWVRELPSPKKQNFTVNMRGSEQQIRVQDMIWIKEPDPINPYGRGTGVAATLNNELDADEFAAQTISHKFANNGMPEFLVSFRGLNDKEVEAARHQWFNETGGVRNIGRPHFTNADIDVEKLDTTFVDLDISNLRELLSKVIREAYGVPPEIVGVVENSNRATIDAAFFLYSKLVILPRLVMLEEHINRQLIPEMQEEGTIILFDDPVQEDKEFALEVIRTAPYAVSVNEIRRFCAKDEIDNEDGELHAIPSGMLMRRFDGTVEDDDEEEIEDPAINFDED